MVQNLAFINFAVLGAVLFIVILLSRSWKRELSKRIMAITIVSLFIVFSTYFNADSSSFFSLSFLPLALVIPFILGPLFFYYIKIIYEKNFKFGKNELIHFLPFGISILLFSIPFSVSVGSNIGIVFKYILIIPIIGILYFIYFVYKSFKLLKKFNDLLVENYASLVEKDLRWITIWVRGLILFLILDFITGLLIGFKVDSEVPLLISAVYLGGLLFYLGYHGVYQKEVLLEELQGSINENERTIYSLKDEDEIRTLTVKLEALFEEGKIFKENTISLKQVADRLETTDKKLSELINVKLHSNFYEFVNDYRIKNFIEIAEKRDSEKFTILAMAFESGFNSKAAFNRIFKDREGITPSQFLKRIRRNKRQIGLTASSKST